MSLAPGPSPLATTESVSDLLAELGRGNREATVYLLDLLYPELQRLARNYMNRERRDHSLQATALVNEAFLRLVEQPGLNWQGRAHFFAAAAQVMRRILVDHARTRSARKRGGGDLRITFTDAIAGEDRTFQVLLIHEALERLSRLNSRQGQVVELRFFGGLSFEEIGLVLNISERTVKRDWALARPWLHAQLGS